MVDLVSCRTCAGHMESYIDMISMLMFGDSNVILYGGDNNRRYFGSIICDGFPDFVKALNIYCSEIVSSCAEILFSNNISKSEFLIWYSNNKPQRKVIVRSRLNHAVAIHTVGYLVKKGMDKILRMCEAIFYSYLSGYINKKTKEKTYDVIGSVTGVEAVILRMFLRTEFGILDPDVRCHFDVEESLFNRDLIRKSNGSRYYGRRVFQVGEFKNDFVSDVTPIFFVSTLKAHNDSNFIQCFEGSTVYCMKKYNDVLKSVSYNRMFISNSNVVLDKYIPPLCKCSIPKHSLVEHDFKFAYDVFECNNHVFDIQDGFLSQAISNNYEEYGGFVPFFRRKEVKKEKEQVTTEEAHDATIRDDYISSIVVEEYIAKHDINNVENGLYNAESCGCDDDGIDDEYDIPSVTGPIIDGTLHRKLDKKSYRVIFCDDRALYSCIMKVVCKDDIRIFATGIGYNEYYAYKYVSKMIWWKRLLWRTFIIAQYNWNKKISPVSVMWNETTKVVRYIKDYRHFDDDKNKKSKN